MIFEYSAYLRNNAIVPIGILVFVIVIAILLTIDICIKVKKKKATKNEVLKYVVLCLDFCLCFVPMNVQTLTNGGAYLLRESENDAKTQTGVIEKIYEPSELYPNFKSSYHFEDGTSIQQFGADITINGEMYFAVFAGDFKVGDTVTITYLPKSKVILSIYYPEDSP
jgi:hypothetical protein